MTYIIIKGRSTIGKRRSEMEENLRKEWGPTMTDEQLDKIKHIEKRVEQGNGSKTTHIHPIDADHLK